MRAEDFELLYNLEAQYWWFVGMRRITDEIVGPQIKKIGNYILDAGCGTGFNLGHYARNSRHVYGFDIAAEAIKGVQQRGFEKIVQGSVIDIPFQSGTFDLVFSFDVVSQIPVDALNHALGEIHRVLKRGGYLFVRVPAFEWLRSSHDEELHTFHRYTRDELVIALTRAGFSVQWAGYANAFLFPIVVLKRALKHVGIGAGSDVQPLPAGLQWLDSIFQGILSHEVQWIRAGRRFRFGSSVICYVRKL